MTNDLFGDAIDLPVSVGTPAAQGQASGTNANFSTEPNEPLISTNPAFPITQTAWYRWVAPLKASALLFGISSNYSNVLTFFKLVGEPDFANLTRLAGTSYNQSISLDVEAGEVLYIQVGCNSGTGGDFTVSYPSVLPPRPVNDDFANAIRLAGTGSVTGTTTGATYETAIGEGANQFPGAFSQAGWKSVWYKWTAAQTGSAQFQLSADYDILYAVYVITGTDAQGNPVLSRQLNGADFGGRPTSFTLDGAAQGATYYIKFYGYNGTGNFTLTYPAGLNPPDPNAPPQYLHPQAIQAGTVIDDVDLELELLVTGSYEVELVATASQQIRRPSETNREPVTLRSSTLGW